MTPPHPQRCKYLFIEGMDVRCTDSSPTKHCEKKKNIHIVEPACWGRISQSEAGAVLDELEKRMKEEIRDSPHALWIGGTKQALRWIVELRSKTKEP